MGRYRDDDHREDASQFSSGIHEPQDLFIRMLRSLQWIISRLGTDVGDGICWRRNMLATTHWRVWKSSIWFYHQHLKSVTIIGHNRHTIWLGDPRTVIFIVRFGFFSVLVRFCSSCVPVMLNQCIFLNINMKYLKIQERRIQVHFRMANQKCRISIKNFVYFGFSMSIQESVLRYDIVRYFTFHGSSSWCSLHRDLWYKSFFSWSNLSF